MYKAKIAKATILNVKDMVKSQPGKTFKDRLYSYIVHERPSLEMQLVVYVYKNKFYESRF